MERLVSDKESMYSWGSGRRKRRRRLDVLGRGEWTAGSREGHGRRAVKVECVYIMHGDGSSDMTVGEERWPSTVNHLDSWRTSIPS